jgi:hypothetical protein
MGLQREFAVGLLHHVLARAMLHPQDTVYPMNMNQSSKIRTHAGLEGAKGDRLALTCKPLPASSFEPGSALTPQHLEDRAPSEGPSCIDVKIVWERVPLRKVFSLSKRPQITRPLIGALDRRQASTPQELQFAWVLALHTTY